VERASGAFIFKLPFPKGGVAGPAINLTFELPLWSLTHPFRLQSVTVTIFCECNAGVIKSITNAIANRVNIFFFMTKALNGIFLNENYSQKKPFNFLIS
jgi:hypothetical protein